MKCCFLQEIELKALEGGKQILEKLSELENFDIIISDVSMPDFTGWDVVREVRKISNIPVIFLTGWGMQISHEKLKEEGVNFILSKPVTKMNYSQQLRACFLRI